MAYANPSQGASQTRTRDIPAPSAATLTNIAGAAVSLALVVGVGVWGYKLFMRDVTGIPVVRAAEGDMRIRPEDPGGQAARHQGLSVNAVAATGAAEAPADLLVLAPRPVELADGDVPMQTIVAAVPLVAPEPEIEVTPQPRLADQAAVAEAIREGSVDALVAELTQGVEPIEAAPEALSEVAAVVVPDVATDAVEVSVTAVAQSLRPVVRPKPITNVQQTSAPADPVIAALAEADPETIPAGTRLVQLGAFDSAEIARAEWDKLNGRFGDYLSGKSRVVQKATSGGRTFYRLRALGFTDLADSRRFCSALLAEQADCIPVQSR